MPITLRTAVLTTAALAFAPSALAQGVVTERNISLGLALAIAQGAIESCTSSGYHVAVTVLDRAGRVIYLGTFSKLLFPSLRLGYTVLPEDLVEPFTAARHLADRQSSALIQAVMTDFMEGGHFARHLKRMRTRYAERQQFLTAQVGRRLGGLLDIRPVESGMYLVAWLPQRWSDRAAAAALAEAGIVAVPLSSFTLTTEREPGLVLGYTGHDEAAMARAVERMAAVLERMAAVLEHKPV